VRGSGLLAILFLLPATALLKAAELKPQTLQAWNAYVSAARARMEDRATGKAPFLWLDEQPDLAQQVRAGEVVVAPADGINLHPAPGGLIHDWIGAVLIPNTTLATTLALVQDYDNHKNIYKPEVMDSRLLTHHGDDFTIFLRLLKKKIITVVMDTYHDVHYQRVSDSQWFLRSYTTRACEVDDAGTPKEIVHPPDTGYGFLWRLYSYWRFMEEGDGVIVECRAISLTRDIPMGLGFIISPIIKNLPRESLINTLKATRQALSGAA